MAGGLRAPARPRDNGHAYGPAHRNDPPHQRQSAKADRRVSEALIDDLKRVTGKTNILFHLADGTLAHPDGVVRDIVYGGPIPKPSITIAS